MPDIDSISSNPFDRIPDKILINDTEAKFDIHCHTFNFDYVPDGFLGIRLPLTRKFMRFTEKILHSINPFSDKDTMSSTAYFFNHPKNWEIVLKTFPKLRLNLAHFGNEERIRDLIKGKDNTWPRRIMDMMGRYENLYTDISYLLHDKKIFGFLKNLLENNILVGERILYGSDYYMIVLAGHFRSIKTDFITAMGDRLYDMISKDNPRRFLGLEL